MSYWHPGQHHGGAAGQGNESGGPPPFGAQSPYSANQPPVMEVPYATVAPYHQPYGDLRAVWEHHDPHPPAPHVVPMPPHEQNTWGVLAHVSYLFLGFLGPLIVMLGWGDRSEWVRANAREALNFALTAMIALIAGYVLSLILIGIPLVVATLVLMWVFPIVAAVRAGRGQFFRYPMAIRFFRKSV